MLLRLGIHICLLVCGRLGTRFVFPSNLVRNIFSACHTWLVAVEKDKKGGVMKTKEEVLEDIFSIVDELTEKEQHFKAVDKRKLLSSISEILDECNMEQFEISRDELSERVRKALILELAYAMLDE